MHMEPLKVGQLATRTGLSVRTLHHYDEIGLLTPASRTASGHRLYGSMEVRRLQQIASLRQLGLPLDEIRRCLGRSGFSLERVLEMQIARLQEDIREKERLRGLLEALQRRIRSDKDVTLDDLTRTIEGTVAVAKYYTPEQLERLAERSDQVGSAALQRAQEEWAELFAAYGDAMERGVDPGAAEVAVLARRSAELIEQFTGSDPEIHASLARMYAAEGAQNVLGRQGMSMKPGLWEYMGQAAASLKEQDDGRS